MERFRFPSVEKVVELKIPYVISEYFRKYCGLSHKVKYVPAI
jgi:hypothetical protein